ncbi:MAG: hypothetical protein IH886_04425 [Nitrospinae bacterium]|nr:hypothetical protein [Nitrospinota bacterium]
MRIYKHKHGTPNPIIQQEEKAILLAVDRALCSSSNSQTIGRNGEVPLLTFLNRYLPPTLKATSGHFITPSGNLSPQLDIMVVDSRYPLLAENSDGSVLAMLHSVAQIIEVKTNLSSKVIKKSWNDSVKIMELATDIDGYGGGLWGAISTEVMAYRCAQKLDTIENSYFSEGKPNKAALDVYILRFPDKDQPVEQEIGGCLHFEPTEDEQESGSVDTFLPTFSASYTPLSDFYYRLVQKSYYTLGARDFSLTDLGEHFMLYMSWSTASWDELYKNN